MTHQETVALRLPTADQPKMAAAPSPWHAHMAEVALLGIAAIWGLTFVIVQDALQELPALTFLAYRFLAAALVVALVFHRQLRQLSAAGWRCACLLALFLTAGYVTQTIGLLYTSAASAGFITGLYVVLTPLCCAFLGQHLRRVAWVAAGTALVGLFLLSGGGRLQWLGDGLEFICACAFAWHIIITGHGAARFPIGALLAVQFALCGMVCLIAATAHGDLMLPHGATVWGALVVTAVLASALGLFVQTTAQRYASPTRTALILTSEPAFAGAASYLLQGTRLSAAGWAGAVLIMLSILAVEALPRLRANTDAADTMAPSPEE